MTLWQEKKIKNRPGSNILKRGKNRLMVESIIDFETTSEIKHY